MSEIRLRYTAGCAIVALHFGIFLVGAMLFIAGGFSFDQFTTTVAIVLPLFAGYAAWRFRREYHHAKRALEQAGTHSEILRPDELSMWDKFALLPRVLPFVILLTGVMIALYGGYATPSETAGLGAVLALALIAATTVTVH